MNALTRTAVAAVLFLCLASAASAADGVGYGIGTGPDKDTSAVRTASQPHEAVQPYKTEEEAENARNVQLTMNECRTITMDAALYHDTPADEFPPRRSAHANTERDLPQDDGNAVAAACRHGKQRGK